MNYIAIPGLKNMPKTLRRIRSETADKILCSVLEHFNITMSELVQKCRRRDIVSRRQMAMYLLCEHTHLTLAKIGEMFNRDHTTVIHAHEQIKGLIKSYDAIRSEIGDIESIFYSKKKNQLS